MSALRVMVVDDDAVVRTLLEEYLAQTAGVTLVGSYESPIDAANTLRTEPVDLLFLDVEMPMMSGLDLARALEVRPKVVLVTSKAEYAAEAFDLDVIDFIVKPVSYARLLRALERARRRESTTVEERTVERVTGDHVFVKVEGRLVKVALQEIFWVEAQGDYVLLHTLRKRYMVHGTMKSIEEKLPAADFVRVHRSHLVRIDRIVDVEEGNLVVERNIIPIGASYRAPLIARLDPL